MSENSGNEVPASAEERELSDRRKFLQGMGKWSGAAAAAAVAGTWLGSAPQAQAGRWVNRRAGGGRWINGRGGGGGAWVNRRYGGGGAWVNRW
jgi:hypothetical protein